MIIILFCSKGKSRVQKNFQYETWQRGPITMNTKGKRLAPFPKIYANPEVLWLWATFDQTPFLFWVLKNALPIADFFSAIHLKTWPLRKKTSSYFCMNSMQICKPSSRGNLIKHLKAISYGVQCISLDSICVLLFRFMIDLKNFGCFNQSDPRHNHGQLQFNHLPLPVLEDFSSRRFLLIATYVLIGRCGYFDFDLTSSLEKCSTSIPQNAASLGAKFHVVSKLLLNSSQNCLYLVIILF